MEHLKECHTTIYGRLPSDKLVDRTEEQRAEESLDFIVRTDIPFSAINHPRFEKFCSYLARCTVTLPDPVIIRCLASRKFDDDKAKLREILWTVEKVSITTSTWISDDDVGILGITVHWIDNTWTLREHVLQVEVSARCHDGEALSCVLRRTLKDYNLYTKVHAITTKNTRDDRTIVAYVQRYSESTVYHTTCMADVINLAVQKGLNGLGNCAVCSDEDYEECDDASFDANQRPDGDTIDRLQKLIMEIKGSNESISCYEALCEDVDVDVENQNLLDEDVQTDWNSTCDMIEAAWEDREVLDKLVKERSSISKEKLKISPEEWDLLKIFVNGSLPFLEIAEILTKSKAIIFIECN
ncbi:putative transcriptional regulator tpeD [Wolffia australiana]